MKTPMKTMITILMFVMTATVFAAPMGSDPVPVDGIWSFSIQTAQGAVVSQAELTVDGVNVSGKLTGPGGEMPVIGMWNADTVRLYANGENGTLIFTGERTPGAITGTAQISGTELGAWTAQRK